MDKKLTRTIGANLNHDGSCTFRVWAPFIARLHLKIVPRHGHVYYLDMSKNDSYFELTTAKVRVGDRYFYCFAEKALPDLAADYQPEGVFGPSEIIRKVKPKPWHAIAISDYIIYELHVGTFSPSGTFAGVIPYLKELKTLGITAIELMPVAQFPGERNWGYDGVLPYAVQNTYGGPDGLKHLISACHELGIAVILDVVYNHLGPEGNFFNDFGPYLTDKYSTPWGKTLNYDGPYSDIVRNYFIENALHWFVEYGIDALRLDALHAIVDTSAYPFLEELADRVKQLSIACGQEFYLIAESCANDPRLIRTKQDYGFGLHAQWNDDFHHGLHTLITNEKDTYYQDYGDINLFLKSYLEGYAYAGDYSAFRKQPHGVSSNAIPAERFVVFMQNHDQIGNRAAGDRLTHSLTAAQLRFAAAIMFFSPYIPLIFMGEEYGERAPFHYFISHTDQQLIAAVRQGRRQEFAFSGEADMPDPYALDTFLASKLNHQLKKEPEYHAMWQYYQKLIDIRRHHSVLQRLDKQQLTFELFAEQQLWLITRTYQSQEICLIANFSNQTLRYPQYINRAGYRLLLDSYAYEAANSSDNNPLEQLMPYGILLFERTTESD